MFQPVLSLFHDFEPYYIMVIAAVGLVGNSLSFSLFAFTRLRKKAMHLLLAALALTDNGFLLVLLLVTMKHFDVDLVNRFEITCKLSVFLPYLFGFLSIWFIVLFSIERFVVVFFPLQRHQLCNAKRNRKVVAALVLFASVFYSYGFWTTELRDDPAGQRVCATIDRWFGLLRVMSVVDSLLTMFLPFVLIATVNVLIIVRLTHKRRYLSKRRRGQASSKAESLTTSLLAESEAPARLKPILRQPPPPPTPPPPPPEPEPTAVDAKTASTTTPPMTRHSSNLLSLATIGNGGAYNYNRRRNASTTTMMSVSTLSAFRSSGNGNGGAGNYQTRVIRFLSNADNADLHSYRLQARQNSRTTRMLLVISTAFLVLHGPTALLKLWYTLAATFAESAEPTSMLSVVNASAATTTAAAPATAEYQADELLERVTCYIYYLHYSLNFFFYVLNIQTFREFFLRTRR